MMKFNFKSMAKDKIIKSKNIVEYTPNTEISIKCDFDIRNKYIFPTKNINENSNVDSIGYIEETETLFIRYKYIRKTIEGIELGLSPEPIGYFYHNVPIKVYEQLFNSKLKSSYINKNIKKNYMYHRELIMNIIFFILSIPFWGIFF